MVRQQTKVTFYEGEGHALKVPKWYLGRDCVRALTQGGSIDGKHILKLDLRPDNGHLLQIRLPPSFPWGWSGFETIWLDAWSSYEDKAMCQSDNQNDKKITEMSAVILQKKLQLEDDRERLDGRTKDWQFDSFLSLHQDCVNKNPTRADSSDFKKFQNLNENLSACVWSAGKEIVRMNENILCYERTPLHCAPWHGIEIERLPLHIYM